MLRILSIFIIVLIFSGCKKDFEQYEYTSGTANFSNYIAVGNSLTQGYQNGGVYEEGQRNSFPSMLARQMKLVEPNMQEFVQPYFTGTGSGYIHLEWKNGKIQVIKPEDPGGYREDPAFANQTYVGTPLSNLGVSGIKLIGAIADPTIIGDDYMSYLLAVGNPYGKRMFDLGQPSSPNYYVNSAVKRKATFFTCWLGDNDVLGYVTNGGDPLAISIFGTNFYVNGLSDANEFKKKYNQVLDSLMKDGAKGVVATVPNVSSIPFVNLVQLKDIKGSDGALLPVYITTDNGVRVATTEDRILLPVASKINKFLRDSLYENGVPVPGEYGGIIQVYSPTPYGMGPANPIKDIEVLDKDELSAVAPALLAINTEIKAAAAAHGLPVVDMEDYLKYFETGFRLGGVEYNTKYIEGGVFSLDGVHPNARGYAIVANKFIEVINKHYKSNIPMVNINQYKGIKFPSY